MSGSTTPIQNPDQSADAPQGCVISPVLFTLYTNECAVNHTCWTNQSDLLQQLSLRSNGSSIIWKAHAKVCFHIYSRYDTFYADLMCIEGSKDYTALSRCIREHRQVWDVSHVMSFSMWRTPCFSHRWPQPVSNSHCRKLLSEVAHPTRRVSANWSILYW